MPLTETEKELQIEPHGTPGITAPDDHRSTWIDKVLHLWSQRLRIGIWMVVGMIMSAGLAMVICKYEATAQLMPPESTSSSSGLAALAAPFLGKASENSGVGSMLGMGDLLGSAKGSGALFAKVLQSQTIENDLIERFNLLQHYGMKYKEDARHKLTSRTTITEDKKSMVLSISVRDKDKDLATALVAAYIEELDKVMAKVATSAARRERIFLEQRLADEKKVLEESERQFSKFASSNMTLDVPQQTKVTVEAAARLQGEMIDARSQLEALEQVYAPDNVRVKSLRARIAALSRDLVKINSGRVMSEVTQDPANPYPSVKNLPLIGVQWTDLYRNTKIHEAVFELLTQRYEVARIQEAKDMPAVKVLDSPSVSERKYPNASQIIFLGTIVSLLLACLGVLLKDRWERLDREDPRRILLSRIYGGVFRPGRARRRNHQVSHY
ncbi:MAG TPA: lipopolysaccharide biosynthesis protein [Candidatus Angelobacter sp.]|nr:lipopolysaccharide biosynthesis protein [Candidatus Angelobacter sp.]